MASRGYSLSARGELRRCVGFACAALAAFWLPTRSAIAKDELQEWLLPDSATAGLLSRHRAEIARLEEELRRATNRDSIRFELARAWRATGTIEGRQRAFRLFERVRPRYFGRPEYHLELARTYLEVGRVADARGEFARVLREDPEDLEARLAVSRVRREQLLGYGQPRDLLDAVAFAAETVERAPESPEAHLEQALCLQLARTFLPEHRVERSLGVLGASEQVLARDPKNRTARALRAVALLDLGRIEEAGRELLAVSAASGPTGGEDILGGGWPTPRRWIDPKSEGSSSGDSLFWASLDPTPLSPENEAELEYWRRLLLADLFFASPVRGRRGWETARGEIFVRYGPPSNLGLRQAYWKEGEATIGTDLALMRKRAHQIVTGLAPYQSPVQSWVYELDGRTVAFDFVDPTLRGEFVLVGTPQQAEVERRLPLLLFDPSTGRRPQSFFAAASARGAGGRTRLDLALALSPEPGAGFDSSFLARVRLLDRAGREAAATRLAPVRSAAGETGPDWPLRAAQGEMIVAPGEYTAEVWFELGRFEGSLTTPVVARDFGAARAGSGDLWSEGAEPFLVSDLRLEVSPDYPNPSGLLPPQGRVLVRYEVYNLLVASDGKARYRSRFVLVPRSFAQAAARQAEGSAGVRDAALVPERLDRARDGIELGERNYLDAIFPEREEPLAPGAVGRFTFELSAAALDPGEYVLAVVVEDRVGNRRASARSLVRVLDDRGWQDLVSGR